MTAFVIALVVGGYAAGRHGLPLAATIVGGGGSCTAWLALNGMIRRRNR